MPNALDHIGIFVDDLDAALPVYATLVGIEHHVLREVPELGLRLAFFRDQGGAIIELVEARGRSELRHGDVVVALEVTDLDAEIARLAAAGIHVHDQPATETLPLRRGWITKGGGHGTIIELCPKGAVARFVDGALRSQTEVG
jgi:predicted enzyme related to lactoylglutathione lyase